MKKWKPLIIGSLAGVTVLWFLLGVLVFLNSDPALSGVFGDTFGAVNALFSAFAFALLIITTLMQSEELKLQRKELRETRKELARSAEAQTKTADLVAKQAESLLYAAYLNALNGLNELSKGTHDADLRLTLLMENALASLESRRRDHTPENWTAAPLVQWCTELSQAVEAFRERVSNADLSRSRVPNVSGRLTDLQNTLVSLKEQLSGNMADLKLRLVEFERRIDIARTLGSAHSETREDMLNALEQDLSRFSKGVTVNYSHKIELATTPRN